ncbi:sulfite exporter TauE/SafE family protein [Dietzia sp. ANT_WB102]|uniref:sulfite exporter TauE/SafE family protein n=1 Tax=Dietzia sp. ANT_WB102 TaxID=2597345 RepID=UPI0011EBB9EE|nr:sulfite exporter TauE/SafE family protein [Dietzia sp. ANT_WB102]KAA0918883.1 sulfite exporter TauE/SafE family protein [Dietzia sp. ANT_WB102]
MLAEIAPQLLLVAAASVILGTVLQRVSGMGVGLVVSPTLVLLLGPVTGVLLTNLTTTVSATLIAITLRRDIDWRRYRRLAPLIVVGSVLGALLVRAVDRSWLEVVIGTLLLATLATTALVRMPPVSGPIPAAVAGTAGGFLNTAVGVAAPAMLIYAHATNWTQRSFAATLQPIFGTMGAVSVITKVGLGAAPITDLPPLIVIALVVAMVPVGITLGGPISRRVSAETGRRLAVVVVTAGALTTLGRGVGHLTGVL